MPTGSSTQEAPGWKRVSNCDVTQPEVPAGHPGPLNFNSLVMNEDYDHLNRDYG